MPLIRNASIRFHEVAVRQSKMFPWVMHDIYFFFGRSQANLAERLLWLRLAFT